MLRNDRIIGLLNEKINQISFKPNQIKKDITAINKKYNIPKGMLSDYLTMRVSVDDASDFILYALASYYLKETILSSFFSQLEIDTYEKTIYQESKISFPLKYNMIQINPTQWIGRITVKELMLLRDAQMINYNERTQRTMERKKNRGGYEYYRIAINEAAVREIEESYESGAYISNTITLNLSDESEVDYVYDPDVNQLIIKSIKYFDILDGYHRYRAMSKAYLKDPAFDYDMELRIVHFDEREAKQFIWQEDQKTKMSRVNSDTYNQNDMAVLITERVSKGLPAGIISRNQSIIDMTQLILAIRCCYATNTIKNVGDAGIIAREIKTKFEDLMLDHPEMFNKHWEHDCIYNTIAVFKNMSENYYDIIQKLNKFTAATEYWRTNPSTRKFNRLFSEFKGGEEQ